MEYDACCGPLHRGERPAATAVALMRSRFTAFALGDVDYLLATWHPGSRPLLGVSFNEASGFVCVESAMAGASLAPGERAHLSQTA